MTKLAGVAVGLMFVALASGPTAAQDRPAADCRDDNGVEICAEQQQRRTRELYGVRSIEEHRDAGDQVRRVFYVDGYGRHVILISFVRSPGRDPTAWIHYPRRDGQARAEPLSAPVAGTIWAEAIARSRNFDRTFAPRPNEPDSICLHSWAFTIESVDRPSGRLPAEVRRKIEDSCEGGPGSAYAAELWRLALPLFPHCAALDPEQHRTPASMLDACRILSGDRIAAAQALNLAGAFRRVGTREEAGLMYGRFGHRAVVDWNGERNAGEGSALDFWLDRIFAEGRPSFFILSVHGESADRVRLQGLLSRSRESPQGDDYHEQAPVEQLWIRDINGELAIERATVGPWERRPAS